ncbi:SIS domain-containing protein [Nocardioides sp. cx-173]|uniref:SIS domain-containing protein n=1 Tax=Nocardioides sp. cx-173 TaxID=2898796 RepID=UPI001E3CDC4D|nr:SIS domain-containing protein [Nocardioides sp. cx-173]MCD4523944.1 SIS domain-containing protein [Nocardioides sp. cx-173]UGB41740.1 SIS domain-containing protein [Nocardioides sp. cx-173]
MSTQMAREIAEQPDAVRRTLAALRPQRDAVRSLLRGRRRVLFAARGSSDNAAIYGRYLLETQAGVAGGLVSPSVATHYRSRLDLSDCVVVSVSQSGATEEIVATQEWARSCGAATLAVTNVADSPLAGAADLSLVTQAGAEVAVPATKTYLTQLVAMAVLTASVLEDPGPLDAALDRVPGEIERLLDVPVDEAVAALRDTAYTVVSGRGLMMGTALETALKLEETCQRPVRGYSYADLRHGPIAVVTQGMTALLLAAPDGPLLEPLVDLADDLASRGARVVGIGGDAAFARACAVHVAGPDLTEAAAPLGAIVPGQRIVEGLARDLGLDPDRPQGLAKVTSTDPHS